MAIIDDEGSMTFAELNDAVDAAANGLLSMGVKGGDGVAILARNHRWWVIANYACGRVGARTIMLNTEFSGPQIRDVAAREGGKVIIYDDEYAEAVKLAEAGVGKLRALSTNPDIDQPSGSTDETPGRPDRAQQTTCPEGHQEGVDHQLDQWHDRNSQGCQPQSAADSRPDRRGPLACAFKAGEVTSLPSPMFHAGLPARHHRDDTRLDAGAAPKVQTRDGPRGHPQAQGDRDRRRPGHALPDARRAGEDGSQAGSLLPADHLRVRLPTRGRTGHPGDEDIGPVVYNLYGSTEIAFVSIARPQDLKKNPATVGPIIRGVKVKILDEHGKEVPRGSVGRIFVGNFFPFEGYTGGGGKEIIDGLMSR
jgi:fatty-acyl-CoA synthase